MSYTVEPTNKSFLSNNKFEFVINRLPNVRFFIQSINLPSVGLLNTQVPNPYVTAQIPGNQLTFEGLTITYMMDENMAGWQEIYNWITNLGNPQGLDKLGTLTKVPGKTNSVTSDASLLIKTNANNPSIRIEFKDLFPSELGGVQFSSTESQDFLTSTISFLYDHYTVTRL
jgi:hypothetical protein